MKAFMFPGQGSQSKGMGGTLFDEFKELTERADSILGYSIKELCLTDPRRELNKTRFTQPALYVVNALSYFKKIQETGKKPDFVLGHSLGEFNALLAAECFDFEAGLKLVKKRGELMSQATDGGMAAILNATKEQIAEILEKNGLSGIDMANYNSPLQTVISGLIEDIGRAQSFFQVGEILYYPLNTSGAFHSRYMQASKEKFENYLKKFKFSEPQIPVIANLTAKPYQNNEIIATLSGQISSAVRWSESIQYLMALDNGEPVEFEEIGHGHGDVLSKMLAKIKEQLAQVAPVQTASITKVESDLENKKTATQLAEEDAAGDLQQGKQVVDDFIKRLNETPKKFVEAEEKVASWNAKHPIGTKVNSTLLGYDELETRTEAVVLFGHRAAVYMKKYNGYFDLDEVTPQ